MKNAACVKVVAFVLVLCFGGSGVAASAGSQQAWPTMPAIDAIAGKVMKKAHLAGLSIAVTRGWKIIHASGYGYASLEHEVPATPNTVYRIGSVTKQFTAAAILQLMERGKLGLDDDVLKYVPELSTGGRTVTIRQLLNHTSGIRSITSIREVMAPRCLDVTQDEVIRWINSKPFDFEPGEQFRYNNSGFWLLGVIIERLTGQTYDEYISKNIFAPLGMEGSYYDSYKRIIPHRARGYVIEDGTFVHGEPNSPTRPYSAGALLSTVVDLVKWQKGLFSGKVIGDEAFRLMTTPGRLNNGKPLQYGFGVFVRNFQGHRQIAHAGGQIGFAAYLTNYPDNGVIIALLTNTQRGAPLHEIEQEVAKLVLSKQTRR